MFKDPIIKIHQTSSTSLSCFLGPGGVLKSEHFDLRDGAAASMFNPPQRRDQKEVGVNSNQSFWRLQSFFFGGGECMMLI